MNQYHVLRIQNVLISQEVTKYLTNMHVVYFLDQQTAYNLTRAINHAMKNA